MYFKWQKFDLYKHSHHMIYKYMKKEFSFLKSNPYEQFNFYAYFKL